MKPVKFEECNVEYAKDQPQYRNLPAFRTEEGEVITFWKMTFKERLRVLLKGGVWLSLHSFNKPLTPSFMTTNKWDLFYKPNDKRLKNPDQ